MHVFNQTITVVNCETKKSTVHYKKTILKNCMFKKKTTKTVQNSQLSIANYYSITIPYREGFNTEWSLNAKNNQDLIILGEFLGEINDDVYTNLLKKDNVGIIKSVSDNTMVNHLKNWKVICE